MWVSLLFDSVFVYRLKGGGQVKITADFFGQIYSLYSRAFGQLRDIITRSRYNLSTPLL